MDTILGYLNSMFAQFPETEEVKKVKADMAAMMEDKYTELKADGKSENEAIGIVISEFGNIDELARELNFDQRTVDPVITTDAAQQSIRKISLSDAKEYIETSEFAMRKIALATSICVCAPILLIVFSVFAEEDVFISEKAATLIGLLVLLAMVAVAVPFFIIYGTKLSKYEYLQEDVFQLETGVDRVLTKMRDEGDMHFGIRIGIGVTLCIIGVLPVIITGVLFEDTDIPAGLSVGVLLAVVSVAVNIFMTTGTKRERFSILLQEGEYSAKHKKGSGLADTIGSIYWPIITAVYLAYSFITNDWGRSWIIWPVAGVLFAAIAGICNLLKKQ